MKEMPPPSASKYFREGLGLLKFMRLAWQFPDLAKQPRGNGHVVMVLPGYGTNDLTTSPLRSYLQYLNYRALGWGLGRNMGDGRALLPKIIEKVSVESKRTGKPISLIGWSLGGLLAREVARNHPEYVEQVITLGSPVVGGPKYTTVAGIYRKKGYDLDEIEKEVEALNEVPLRVPVTAIYSKSDNVVYWGACIDQISEYVDHLEVSSTHLGLGIDPDVYQIIAERLASPPMNGRI